MATTIDALAAYFQYKGLPFPKKFMTDVPVTIPKYEGVKYIEGGSIDELSGLPVFTPLNIDGFDFIVEPLISISSASILKETPLSAIDAEVTEEITRRAYILNVNGVFVNTEADELPEEEIAKLRHIREKKTSVKISSPLLRIFNINEVSFKSFEMPSVPGSQNWQGFSFVLKDEKPVQLVYKNKPTS